MDKQAAIIVPGIPDVYGIAFAALEAGADLSTISLSVGEPTKPKSRLRTAVSAAIGTVDEKNELFVHAPLDWLERSAALPGKAALVAIELAFLHRVGGRTNPVKLTYQRLKHVSRQAIYRALETLHDADLISYRPQTGQQPLVTLQFDSTKWKSHSERVGHGHECVE